jgi:hypothetical protein
MKSNLIILYPYKFGDFLWKKYHLDKLSKVCHVEVWDLSKIVHKNFAKKIYSRVENNYRIIEFRNVFQFINYLDKFMNTSKQSKNYFLDKVSVINLRTFIIRIILWKYLDKQNAKILREINGGFPMKKSFEGKQNNGLKSYFKMIKIISDVNSLQNLLFVIRAFFYSKIDKLIPFNIHYQLVAGEFYESKAREELNLNIVKYNSIDYSEYLEFRKQNIDNFNNNLDNIILLDSADPYFFEDKVLSKEKVRLTINTWYPLLNNFCKILEQKYNTEVKIMGHYKTNFESPSKIFGNREVLYGRTLESTMRAKFVVNRDSSSISYAVILRKPIVFIYSNELLLDKVVMKYIYNMAIELGTHPINLNNPPIDLTPYLNVDLEKYRNFEKNFLTSSFSKSNYDILVQDIMQLE